MKRIRLLVLAIPALLAACQSGGGRETIAQLRHVKIEIKEEAIQGGLEKAMQGYERFLAETPESTLTPAAIRRLADLKVEREYGSPTLPAAAAGGVALAGPERAERSPGSPSRSRILKEGRCKIRQQPARGAIRAGRTAKGSKGPAPVRRSRSTSSSWTSTRSTRGTTGSCTRCPGPTRNWGRPKRPWW